MTHTTIGVILAAGSGHRYGGAVPKQLLDLAGRPIIAWSALAFEEATSIDEVVVVTRADLVDAVHDVLDDAGIGKLAAVVPGGDTRVASSAAALAALADHGDTDHVLLHDAVRPLVRPADIDAVDALLATHHAAGLAAPATDTIWEVDDGVVVGVPDRSALWRAQTPQGFHLGLLRTVHRLDAAARAEPPDTTSPAAHGVTDDVGLVRRHRPDVVIAVAEGSAGNLKVTTPDDLLIAARLLDT